MSDQILFRCHSLGKLFSADRYGKGFGVVAKKQLRAMWTLHKYGRRKSFDNKFVGKGRKGEAEGLRLLTMSGKEIYFKNTIRIENEWLSGEPDTSDAAIITDATEIVDIKCSWDAHTFFESLDADLKSDYEWQGHGYMALIPSAKSHSVIHVLINTPDDIINHELYRDSFNWENNEQPLWAKIQLISEMIYDKKNFYRFLNQHNLTPTDNESVAMYEAFVEIPIAERKHTKTFERDELKIAELYAKLQQCREYIQNTF